MQSHAIMLILHRPENLCSCELLTSGCRRDSAGEAQHLWAGDARSCAVYDNGAQQPVLFVGTEPADVVWSADGGASWQREGGFRQLASRDSWQVQP